MTAELPFQEKTKVKKAPLFHPLSRRLHILFLIMTGFCCTTFMRMHLAITMTCMVNSTAIAIQDNISLMETILSENSSLLGNTTTTFSEPSSSKCGLSQGEGHHVVVDYGGTLVWDYKEQNIIFSGTFWGAMIVCLPAMFIVQRSSPRIVFLCAMLVYVLSSAVTPFLAERFGYLAVFLIRALMGLGEGVVIPSINAIISNWFPVEERSTALALFTTGNQIAGAGGNPIAAALCASSLGWPAIFYMCAIVGSAWSILWGFTSSDQPSKCKLMTTREREYLSAKVVSRNKKAQKSQSIPYRKVFTSLPFLAQLQSHFVINFMMCFLQLYLPLYLKDVLLLGVLANGTFIAIPNVFNFSFKIVWSMVMDKLKEKKWLSPTAAVKISQSIANFGGGIALLSIAFFIDCSVPGIALAVFCFMYCCMGTFTSGFYTSLLSLAPRYTATLSSISQFFSMLGRLCTPAIVGLVKQSGTIEEWRTLFLLAAGISFVSGAIFALFGSGDVQEWGKEDAKEEPHQLCEAIALVQRTKTESICM